MPKYDWNAEALILSTQKPGSADLSHLPTRGTLAAMIRIVMEELTDDHRHGLRIEYSGGSLDMAAITAAYESKEFPKQAATGRA